MNRPFTKKFQLSKSHFVFDYYEIKTDARRTRAKTIKKSIEIYQGICIKLAICPKTQDKSLSGGEPSNKKSITLSFFFFMEVKPCF